MTVFWYIFHGMLPQCKELNALLKSFLQRRGPAICYCSSTSARSINSDLVACAQLMVTHLSFCQLVVRHCDRAFPVAAPRAWNSLPASVRDFTSLEHLPSRTEDVLVSSQLRTLTSKINTFIASFGEWPRVFFLLLKSAPAPILTWKLHSNLIIICCYYYYYYYYIFWY